MSIPLTNNDKESVHNIITNISSGHSLAQVKLCPQVVQLHRKPRFLTGHLYGIVVPAGSLVVIRTGNPRLAPHCMLAELGPRALDMV